MLLLFSIRVAEWPLACEELFIRFTVRVLCQCNTFISICVCPLPFSFEGGMRVVILLIPDHCLSFYFLYI